MSVHCKQRESKNCVEYSKDVLDYEWLVISMARKIKKNLPPHVLLDDLVQDGYIGAMKALVNYDPSQGATIETYMAIRIRGNILDGLRHMQMCARRKMSVGDGNITENTIKEVRQSIEQEQLREVRDKEIASLLGISLERYQKYIGESVKMVTIINDDEEGDFKSEWAIREGNIRKSSDILDGIIGDECREVIRSFIESLSKKEKLIVNLYLADLNLREIGAVIGVSESRVSQIFRINIKKKFLEVEKEFRYEF